MAIFSATRLRDAIKTALDGAFGSGNAAMSTARTSFSNAIATPVVNELACGFRATSIWNVTASALPLTGSFTSDGGTVVLYVAGSMYVSAAGTIASMNVLVDGTSRATLRLFCNESYSHKALVPAVCVVSGLVAGSHALQLTVGNGITDVNDFFTAAVLELPV
jgi:hypothetical protein